VSCAVAALEAGATRLHGAALGIGERCGNTPIDLLLVNLVMMGYIDRDITSLGAYCQAVSRACDVPIPANYPVIGADAFRTATGVHAAAVVKAFRKGDRALMDSVYEIGEHTSELQSRSDLVCRLLLRHPCRPPSPYTTLFRSYIDRDITSLGAYCQAVSRACDVPIPANYPVIGADAFRTATGVHAAAVVKAFRKGDRALMDSVY